MFKNFTDITQVTMISHPQIVTFKKSTNQVFCKDIIKILETKFLIGIFVLNFNFKLFWFLELF